MIYKWNAQEIIDHGDPWKVVVDLILQLSAIVELYYMCPEQFSPCLLAALHEWWRPKCRLYIKSSIIATLTAKSSSY